MNKIELKNITVKYGKKTVLNNFDLTVEEGQILGIVGPSGCGKTTVVRAICGFLDPQEGTVTISGNVMYDPKEPMSPRKEEMSASSFRTMRSGRI